MDKRVEQWCDAHYATLLQPYTSALRPVSLKCRLCATERTERAAVLVEQERCPTCPQWTLERDGWVVERPYDMDGTVFIYGIDIEGTAVVLDAAASDDRRTSVERNGFKYLPVHAGMSVEDVYSKCTDTVPPAPLAPLAPKEETVLYVSPRPRYGWKWVGSNRPLEHEPSEQATIAWLRAERAAHPTLTVNALCARLEQHPEFPRRGAKRWHPTAVQRILEHNGIPVRPNYYA